MAERVGGKSRGKKKGMKGSVATLPKGKRGKKARAGNNEHAVSDDVILSHMAKIDRTGKDMAKAKEEYDQKKGVHQSAFKAAKEVGIDIDALRFTRKTMKRDAGVVVQEFAQVHRMLTLAKHELGADQLDLFGGITAATVAAVDPKQQGIMAGRNAEPADVNPHKPGSEEFVTWAEGWEAGQQENREKFKGTGAAIN